MFYFCVALKTMKVPISKYVNSEGFGLQAQANPRAEWDAAFQCARLTGGDEVLLLPEVFEDEECRF